MTVLVGMFSRPSSSYSSTMALRRNGVKVGMRSGGRLVCRATAAGIGNLMDQYRTLRIQPGASEKEVKKALRQFALQYHPDVCKGSNCGVQFHLINEAYDVAMTHPLAVTVCNIYLETLISDQNMGIATIKFEI